MRRPTPRDDRGRARDATIDSARFAPPEAASWHVSRPRLTARLAGGDHLPLVLVSAPAGTGKTEVVAEWTRRRRGATICWVGFEEGAPCFWGPVLESLRRHGVDVPETWTIAPGAGLGGERLDELVSLLTMAPEPLTVVVDGHTLVSRQIAREVDGLRECGPSVRRLLAADPRLAERHAWLHQPGQAPGSSRPSQDDHRHSLVVEALTPKEREVLERMAEFLTTEEIAQKLFVSVNTVRTHIRHILRKLGVDRRNAAIRRARSLGILEG